MTKQELIAFMQVLPWDAEVVVKMRDEHDDANPDANVAAYGTDVVYDAKAGKVIIIAG